MYILLTYGEVGVEVIDDAFRNRLFKNFTILFLLNQCIGRHRQYIDGYGRIAFDAIESMNAVPFKPDPNSNDVPFSANRAFYVAASNHIADLI